MSLEALLRKAVAIGGSEVRLASAHKITIVTADGEREVRGPELTPQLIEQFVGPVVPPSAREALASGHAEWTVRHRELGSIRIVAEQDRASFFFAEAEPQPRLSLVPSPTSEMDSLFTQMFAMK